MQTPETTRRIADFAHVRGLKVHLDGARIFNAAAALNVNVKELTDPVELGYILFEQGIMRAGWLGVMR